MIIQQREWGRQSDTEFLPDFRFVNIKRSAYREWRTKHTVIDAECILLVPCRTLFFLGKMHASLWCDHVEQLQKVFECKVTLAKVRVTATMCSWESLERTVPGMGSAVRNDTFHYQSQAKLESEWRLNLLCCSHFSQFSIIDSSQFHSSDPFHLLFDLINISWYIKLTQDPIHPSFKIKRWNPWPPIKVITSKIKPYNKDVNKTNPM